MCQSKSITVYKHGDLELKKATKAKGKRTSDFKSRVWKEMGRMARNGMMIK